MGLLMKAINFKQQLLIIIFSVLMINLSNGQNKTRDEYWGTYKSEKTDSLKIKDNNDNIDFKILLTPHFSLLIPLSGEIISIDDLKADISSICLKYGAGFSFRVNKFIIDFDFSFSQYNIPDKIIKDLIPPVSVPSGYGSQKLEKVNLSECKYSPASVRHYTTGFRYIISTKPWINDYLSVGIGYYDRDDIIIEYKGKVQGKNYTYNIVNGMVRAAKAESAFSTYIGGGAMILIHKNIGIDSKVNFHVIFLEKNLTIWVEPSIGFCLIL